MSFESLARATAGLPANYRCQIFGSLPADLQERCWRDLAEQCRRHNELLRLLGARRRA